MGQRGAGVGDGVEGVGMGGNGAEGEGWEAMGQRGWGEEMGQMRWRVGGDGTEDVRGIRWARGGKR